MNYKLAPSMMCCDLLNVGKQIEMFEAQKIDLLHIDIMDGSFVPNIALGTCFAEQLRGVSKIPMDFHFMINSPEYFMNTLPIEEGDYVSIHFESTLHVQRAIQTAKSKGANVLLALNPATPVEMISEVLDDIDGVLIMSVNPGYAGQRMIPNSINKIRRTRLLLDNNGRADAKIEVDGNVSIENAVKMREAGADIFVLGTAIQKNKGIFDAADLERFRQSVT